MRWQGTYITRALHFIKVSTTDELQVSCSQYVFQPRSTFNALWKNTTKIKIVICALPRRRLDAARLLWMDTGATRWWVVSLSDPTLISNILSVCFGQPNVFKLGRLTDARGRLFHYVALYFWFQVKNKRQFSSGHEHGGSHPGIVLLTLISHYQAVLAGDFILARATQALCQIGDPRVISTMAKIIEDLVVVGLVFDLWTLTDRVVILSKLYVFYLVLLNVRKIDSEKVLCVDRRYPSKIRVSRISMNPLIFGCSDFLSCADIPKFDLAHIQFETSNKDDY